MIDRTAGTGEAGDDERGTGVDDPSLYSARFGGIRRHELVAGAAGRLITSQRAKDRIAGLLDDQSLADVAAWADDVKRMRVDDAPDQETVDFLRDPRNGETPLWHFVNLPLGAERYDRARYPAFTRDEDLVQILAESIRVLLGQSRRFSQVNALRLVAHLTGEIHQPLHVACCYLRESGGTAVLVQDPDDAARDSLRPDQGGNRLILPGGATLHSYWDSRPVGGGERDLHRFSDTAGPEPAPNLPPEAQRPFVEQLLEIVERDRGNAGRRSVALAEAVPPERRAELWATESLPAARAAYQSLAVSAQVSTQGDVNSKWKVTFEGKRGYDQRCQPILERQLCRAAENLAAVLDAIWP